MLEEKIKGLPSNSGVYLMLSEGGEIIYVGKAKNLKNRVKSYFNAGVKTEKTAIMLTKIADFRYIITKSEIDALVLENNLIKKYQPRYNILLKDDKNYPFIRIDLKEKFPRLTIVRKLKPDGAKYYGPYMVGISIKEILEIVNSAFCLRECNTDLSKIKNPQKPCLNFHIKRCFAPCAGFISEEEYALELKKVMDFLSGESKEVEKILTEKMDKSAEDLEFELAMHYRDELKKLEKITRKQISAYPKDFNLDVFSYASDGLYGAISMLVVRDGKILGGENFTSEDGGFSSSDSLVSFIVQFYKNNGVNCDEIVIGQEIEEVSAVEDMLFNFSQKKVKIIIAERGVRGQLVDMAYKNACDYLEKSIEKIERKEELTRHAVTQLKELLSLKKLPSRIECFDISNISGTNKVASMVVFKSGERAKKHYRRFKIKTVEGANDFASMQEVLIRRLYELKNSKDESFSETPDLIIVDGGKGQVSSAMEAMHDSGFNIELIGLAKREEEVFFPERREPVILPRNSLALSLIQRVRDEAHRFAITFHRELRAKKQTESILLKIEGIGKEKIKSLFETFKSINAIKEASLNDLQKAKGIGGELAKNIYKYFHEEKNEI